MAQGKPTCEGSRLARDFPRGQGGILSVWGGFHPADPRGGGNHRFAPSNRSRQEGTLPVVCRLCLRPDIMEQMTGCLVEEVRAGTLTAETIIQNLPIIEAAQGQPECFELDSGEFLLRQIPKVIYRELLGTTQITKEEAQIHWRQSMATDGALMARKETVTVEVRGAPFGLRSSNHTANLVRGFGSLQSIINNGLQQGNPNVMRIAVAVFGESNVPPSVAINQTLGGPLAIFSVVPGSSPILGPRCSQTPPVNSSRTPLENSAPRAPSALRTTHQVRCLPRRMKAFHEAPTHFDPTGPPRLAELGKWCACKAE